MKMRMEMSVTKTEVITNMKKKHNLNEQRARIWVVTYLKALYINSEVTSGEFIHTVKFPSERKSDTSPETHDLQINEKSLKRGIQDFLDWDESPEDFDVIKFGEHWYTTKHFTTYEDFYTFDGINYPTKILNATIDEHNDDWVHSYLVAPESLYDKIEAYTGDTDDERFMDSIDSEVYHYIEDQYWDLPDEELAKEHLDLSMTIVKDEDL